MMVDRKDIDAKLKRLDEVASLYGADMARWPDADLALLEGFVDKEPEAVRILSEARALDLLFAETPVLEPTSALRERILSAALQDYSGDVVVDFRDHRQRFGTGVCSLKHWPAAGLLAASLAIGVYLGVSGLSEYAFNRVIEVASISDVVDEDSETGLFLPSISFEDGIVQSEELL